MHDAAEIVNLPPAMPGAGWRKTCYFICCEARGVSEKSDYVHVILSSRWTSVNQDKFRKEVFS
uniref:Uncharacterized protein n=1 Tax=Arundo donax TaxID=35708 RepID=A0A0A9CT12_ARUDO